MDQRLIAILRGIKPEETEGIVAVLIEAGIGGIEIPLNSPSAYESIGIAVDTASARFGTGMLVGAGTVLNPDEVQRVHDVGGNLIVSPGCDHRTISATVQLDMVSMPGVLTASDCMTAMENGAMHLKVFPASVIGPTGTRALRSVLPESIRLFAVGGVDAADFKSYLASGIAGFGLGSSLYRPGMSVDHVGKLARRCVSAMKQALG